MNKDKEVFACDDCGVRPRTGNYRRCWHCADNRWRRAKGLPEINPEERKNRGWEKRPEKSLRTQPHWSGNPNTKFCRTCRTEKSLAYFQSHYPITVTHQRCLTCLGTKIAPTTKSWKDLLSYFGDHCQICGKIVEKRQKKALDHCHKTGRIRGLLCQSCNIAEGLLRSDASLIRRLALYVEKHERDAALSDVPR